MGFVRAVGCAAAIATIAAIGCKKDDASPTDPAVRNLSHTSGQRLRARVIETGSAAVFLGWFDAALGLPCSFATAEDGELRCLPDEPPGYASPFCDPVVIPEPNDHPQRCPGDVYADGYALKFAKTCASAGAAVYAAGGVVDAPTTCPDGPPLVAGNYEPHSASHVPPSTFARGSETTVPLGTRLAQRVISGDDGAREVRGIFDPTIGEPCFALASTCVPTSAQIVATTYFSDAACAGSEPLVAVESGCLASRFALSAPYGCGVPTYVSFGAAVDASKVFAKYGATSCTPAASSFSYYTPGAPVPAETFAAVQEVPVGSGRIVALADADAQGVAVRMNGGLEDTQLGTKCADARVDGVERCVPLTYATASLPPEPQRFADNACTQRLVSTFADTCAPPAPKPPAVVVVTSPCDAELHGVGDVFTGVVWTLTSAGTCRPDVPNKYRTDYRIGDRIPSDGLAELTRVTE